MNHNLFENEHLFAIQDDWVIKTASLDQPQQLSQIYKKLETSEFPFSYKLWLKVLVYAYSEDYKIGKWLVLLLIPLIRRPSLNISLHKAIDLFNRGMLEKSKQVCREIVSKYPGDLQAIRVINKLHPSLFLFKKNDVAPPKPNSRIAIIVAGELRLISRSMTFFNNLAQYCPLFICTSTKAKEHVLLSLISPNVKVALEEDDPTLPFSAMQQWMRLDKALRLISEAEKEQDEPFTHIIKLRTDFYHANPKEILSATCQMNGGILASSDKVLGGDRESMMSFCDFYARIQDYVCDEKTILPLSLDQIKESEECYKWFGNLLPETLFKKMTHPGSCREEMMKLSDEEFLERKNHMDEFSISLENGKGVRLMKTIYQYSLPGEKKFASELAFASFLSQRGIPVRFHASYGGVLWSDRISN